MSNDIPLAWRQLLERKGIRPSYRGLAQRAGLAHETVRKVVRGWATSHASIYAVADALGVDVETVYELRGEGPDRPQPWTPPASSSLLSQEERDALARLISTMTRDRQERESRGNTAPMKPDLVLLDGDGATAAVVETREVFTPEDRRRLGEAVRRALGWSVERAAGAEVSFEGPDPSPAGTAASSRHSRARGVRSGS